MNRWECNECMASWKEDVGNEERKPCAVEIPDGPPGFCPVHGHATEDGGSWVLSPSQAPPAEPTGEDEIEEESYDPTWGLGFSR